MPSERRPLGLGIAGLGRAFMLTLPSILADRRFNLVAAAAPRPESRRAFETQFGGTTHETVEALCHDPAVEAVYIATPHQMHADHIRAAAKAGKHVLVDKPLAVSMQDGEAMVAVAAQAGIHLLVGPSHSFDGPVAQALALIQEGSLGRVRMLQAFNYTDFLYRPRRPEELLTSEGGGVIYSQAVHQIDIIRLLAGGQARSVAAACGRWDPQRPTEGAYAALVGFEGGAFASMVYSGYAHFDSDEWMDWIGELGAPKDPTTYGKARKMLAGVSTPDEEASLKQSRAFGAGDLPPLAPENEHFGPIIISMDSADLRLTPRGIWIHADSERRFLPTPKAPSPRSGVLDALWDAVRDNRPPVQTGAWGLANLELCHAILTSADTGQTVSLTRQIGI
ncbi:MAG: Gfo/Idh/MocA family oxidoreductase [Anderseniella sp.]|nr:Gfo/Idh/MocA family oxidoreductase [Anderseniella sp.]